MKGCCIRMWRILSVIFTPHATALPVTVHEPQQPLLSTNQIPCEEVTFATTRERVTGPVDGTSWCYNRITQSHPKFTKTDQVTCESFYLDPVNFVIIPDYGFDCTGGCSPCVYTNESQNGWGCMLSKEIYRCPKPTQPNTRVITHTTNRASATAQP